MVYFQDDLSYYQRFHIDNIAKAAMIEHILDNGDDCEYDPCVYIAGTVSPQEISERFGSQKMPTLRLTTTDSTPLSALAAYAHVEIGIDEDEGVTTPLSFIQNYENVIKGYDETWRLCAVMVNPTTTYLCYANRGDDCIEQIVIRDCPLQFVIEVPVNDNHQSGGRRNVTRLHGFSMGSERVIIMQDLEAKQTQLWTGRVYSRADEDALESGQSSLIISYDDDDDIKVTRMYHMSDFNEKLLQEKLSYNKKQHTFLL